MAAPSRLSPRSANAAQALQATHWLLWLALLLAGALQAISLAWPWARGLEPGWLSLPGGYGRPLWWLQIASLAVMAYGLLTASTGKQAAGRAMVFATTWLVGAFWWLFISMHSYGGLAAPLAAAAVLLVAVFLGCYYATAAWFFSWCFKGLRQYSKVQAAIVFASVWTLAELARGWLWTGFPWGASGYAHIEGPLAVLPRWVGVYGTGFVAAWLAAWLAIAVMAILRDKDLSAFSWRRTALIVALTGVWLFLWTGREGAINAPATSAPMSVELLQGNIPQDEKFEQGSGIPLALNWYAQALHNAKAQLVVAPETAIPLLPQQLPEGYMELVSGPFVRAGGQQAALVGVPLGSFEQGYTNSVLGWMPGASTGVKTGVSTQADHAQHHGHGTQTHSPQEQPSLQQPVYQYSKHHLVPFGEFIPPMFRWFTDLMNIPLGDFNRGGLAQPSLNWQGQRLSPNICYEDLFGEEIGANFRDASQAPTILVNFSNIGWFNNSVALDQHLAISRMRTLEFERPMLRATNTGATVVIDHTGKVQSALPPLERAVLRSKVQGREGLTPYARWVSALGLVPLAVLCLLAVAWCRGRQRR